jgi:hypothetical protein
VVAFVWLRPADLAGDRVAVAAHRAGGRATRA